MTPVSVSQGSSPIILGLPHTGTFVPDDVAACLNENGRKLADTDWHIDRLYQGLLPEITTVKANYHRYFIDVNRDPEGHSLYPGQNTTPLVPLTDFDNQGIWNTPPDAAEVQRRLAISHAPYHAAMQAEVDRVHALHGFAIHYDCHSIRSEIPFLFECQLPALNIGTNDGSTCAPSISGIVEDIARSSDFSMVLNGRFKGGWTTRHYGQPDKGVHAIQLEIAQRSYLTREAAPWAYDVQKADLLRQTLRSILTSLNSWRPTQ